MIWGGIAGIIVLISLILQPDTPQLPLAQEVGELSVRTPPLDIATPPVYGSNMSRSSLYSPLNPSSSDEKLERQMKSPLSAAGTKEVSELYSLL